MKKRLALSWIIIKLGDRGARVASTATHISASSGPSQKGDSCSIGFVNVRVKIYRDNVTLRRMWYFIKRSVPNGSRLRVLVKIQISWNSNRFRTGRLVLICNLGEC